MLILADNLWMIMSSWTINDNSKCLSCCLLLLGSQQENWECLQQVQTNASEERWCKQNSPDKHSCKVSAIT